MPHATWRLIKFFSDLYLESRKLRWTGHIAIMKDGGSAFKILTRKPTEKVSHYQIRREKFESEPGLEPRISRSLGWRSTIELSWFNCQFTLKFFS